nr:MAG TPA: hypothetical protein [Caudoviricetes sp.]
MFLYKVFHLYQYKQIHQHFQLCNLHMSLQIQYYHIQLFAY